VIAVASCLALSTTAGGRARLGVIGDLLAALRFGGLNTADAAELERGYYENLMGVDRFNGQLWDLYMNRPTDWRVGLSEAGLSRSVEGLPDFELVPSAEGRFKGAVLRTNSWGMHDREYSLQRPPECRRLAVLGASHTMGSGVPREATFEAMLEARLNREPISPASPCVEVLNFAVYGYTPLAQVRVFTGKVASFEPTALLYVAHPGDAKRMVQFLAAGVRRGKTVPYQELRDILSRARVDPSLAEREGYQRLLPYGDDIVAWLYETLVQESRRRGTVAGYVFLPMVPELTYSEGESAGQIALARRAGFVTIDLSDVYKGHDRQSLWVAEWDAHPNARAHRLVADAIYSALAGGARPLLAPGGAGFDREAR
jgi:hypothetical protein